MSTNIPNKSPYLRSSRDFPTDSQGLSVELAKSYVDIATNVNSRTIGNYASVSTVTGNTWFTGGSNVKQQTLRKVFLFTATTSVDHGIANVPVGNFIGCYGSYTDGTSNYGLIFGTSVAVAGQILFYITTTQIVFVVGAGAPALTSGKIVVEWLSNV